MKLMKEIRAQGYNYKSVIIVGVNDKGENIRKFLSKDLTYGYRFLGFFDDKVDPLQLFRVQCLVVLMLLMPM
jgi:undecaprenyl-phosphate galactose phosphotransferase/putative colanic acid biosynthesis UDP-glucose lipid carrier transferase